MLVKERKAALEEKKTREDWRLGLHGCIFDIRRSGDISQMAVVDYERTKRVKTTEGLLLQEPVFTKEGVC